MNNESIGLAELIEKVKTELLTPPNPTEKSVPFLFVDNLELELQVVVKKDAKTGLKIDVIGIGGANIGGDVAQQNLQKVKVSLSPLFTKEEMKEHYKILQPKSYERSRFHSQGAIMKGGEDDDWIDAE
ncbi:MAG: hypothetical protein MGG11_17345 [Trichodesmium sp. MAG_R03]|nr:hypothetical protein [Trichodesmium sp. MAG_R03]